MVFYDTVVKLNDSSETSFHQILHSSFEFFYILFGSAFFGFLIGFLASLFLKKVSERVSEILRIELFLLIIFPWFCYLVLYIYGLSAIVVIFFIGVSMNLYCKPIVSERGSHYVHSLYEEVVFVSESIIFLIIGLSFCIEHPYEYNFF
jgi:sodium/hydrogen exchanger 8